MFLSRVAAAAPVDDILQFIYVKLPYIAKRAISVFKFNYEQLREIGSVQISVSQSYAGRLISKDLCYRGTLVREFVTRNRRRNSTTDVIPSTTFTNTKN